MTCVICIGVIVLFVNYIFVIITACNVPVFRYIFVVFVSKNREKWNKKIWSLCRVHREKHSAKVAIRGIPKKATLPSASRPTFGKVSNFPKCQILALGKVLVFAECRPLGTRQTRRQPPPPRGKFAEALSNPFAECPRSGNRQRPFCRQGLCRV